jgi:hypothetical protein
MLGARPRRGLEGHDVDVGRVTALSIADCEAQFARIARRLPNAAELRVAGEAADCGVYLESGINVIERRPASGGRGRRRPRPSRAWLVVQMGVWHARCEYAIAPERRCSVVR